MNRMLHTLRAFVTGPFFETPPQKWHGFLCVAFIGVPLLLGILGYGQVFEAEREYRELEFLGKMDEMQAEIVAAADPLPTMDLWMERFRARMEADDGRTADLELRLLHELKTLAPGLLHLTLLQSSGEPHPALNDHGLSAGLGAVLVKLYGGHQVLADQVAAHRQEALGVLGPLINPFVPQFDRLCRVSLRRERRYGFLIHRFEAAGKLVVGHLDDPEDLPIRLVRGRIDSLNRQGGEFQAALVPVGSESEQLAPGEETFREDVEFIRGALETTLARQTFWDGRFWSRFAVSPSWTVVLAGTLPHQARRAANLLRLQVGGLLLFVILSILLLRELTRREPLFLSLRLKIALILIFAVGVPLGVLGLTQALYQQKLRVRLERGVYRENEAFLRRWDQDFQQHIGAVETGLSGLLEKIDPSSQSFLDQVRKVFRRIHKRFKPYPIELIDRNGNKVRLGDFTSEEQNIAPGEVDILRKLAREMLARLNPDHSQLLDESDRMLLGAMAEMSGIPLTVAMSEMYRHIGMMYQFLFGNTRTYLFLHPFFLDGRAEYLAVFGWDQRQMQSRWMAQRQFSGPGLPFPDSTLLRLESTFFQRIPEDLQGFYRTLKRQTFALHQPVIRAGRRFLATGLLSEVLTDQMLILLTPADQLEPSLGAEQRRAAGKVLIVLLLTIALAIAIIRGFIVPVRHLTERIGALERRDFQARIPVVTHDELGELAQAFNRLGESLEDLEVARIVQESLFPQQTLQHAGWEIAGSCRCAVQVGGDYYDFFPLEGGRVAAIIGDVSGHGVAAALIMGMAKGFMRTQAGNLGNPEIVLNAMNKALHQRLGGKKFMTFQILLLDSEAGSLRIANAGHCYPVIERADRVEMLPCSGLPLGATLKATYRWAEVPLLGITRIVLYSDGFPEALDVGGEQIGYDRLYGALPECRGTDPVATIARLTEWHLRITRNAPLQDDATVVILQRQS